MAKVQRRILMQTMKDRFIATYTSQSVSNQIYLELAVRTIFDDVVVSICLNSLWE